MNRSRLIHERSLRTAHRKAITALNATINKETTVSTVRCLQRSCPS
jgi:hypothetical protein